jgi:hypothetical protein
VGGSSVDVNTAEKRRKTEAESLASCAATQPSVEHPPSTQAATERPRVQPSSGSAQKSSGPIHGSSSISTPMSDIERSLFTQINMVQMLNDVPFNKPLSHPRDGSPGSHHHETDDDQHHPVVESDQARSTRTRKSNDRYTFLEKMALRSFFFDCDVTKKQKFLISVPDENYL